MKILSIAIVAAISGSLVNTAEAQRRGNRADKIIAKLDTNKDGKISKDEAKDSRLAKRFDKIDKNSDGFITKDELTGKGRRRRRRS